MGSHYRNGWYRVRPGLYQRYFVGHGYVTIERGEVTGLWHWSHRKAGGSRCLLRDAISDCQKAVGDAEAFKAKCRESSPTEAEHKKRSRARRMELKRKAVFG